MPLITQSSKCTDPMVFEFVVSNTTGNNQQEKCISLDFNFRNSSEPWNDPISQIYFLNDINIKKKNQF
jgi:hypothetical protein